MPDKLALLLGWEPPEPEPKKPDPPKAEPPPVEGVELSVPHRFIDGHIYGDADGPSVDGLTIASWADDPPNNSFYIEQGNSLMRFEDGEINIIPENRINVINTNLVRLYPCLDAVNDGSVMVLDLNGNAAVWGDATHAFWDNAPVLGISIGWDGATVTVLEDGIVEATTVGVNGNPGERVYIAPMGMLSTNPDDGPEIGYVASFDAIRIRIP